VFRAPKDGDAEIINVRLGDLFRKLQADPEDAWYKVSILLNSGCPADYPGFREFVSALCEKDQQEGKPFCTMAIQAALHIGWQGQEEPVKSLTHYESGNIGRPMADWSPWEPGLQMPALWAGRRLVDVSRAIDRWVQLLWENTDQAGCWNKLDPWNVLEAVSIPDHPLCAKLVARYIPMILRTQTADGGWGDRGRDLHARSRAVFPALAKYGLLEQLRKLPPLPPDWRIARSIPAPEGDLWTLTWDGARLWILDRSTKEAVAVAPEDGAVVKRLAVPSVGPGEVRGIGWYNDLLVVTAGGTEHHGGQSVLLLVDPEDGTLRKVFPIDAQWGPCGSTQIGDDLWIAHGCWMCVVNPETGETHGQRHTNYGSWPVDIAAEDGAIWHTDEWAPFLFKSDLSDHLLEFFEQPFFERLQDGLPATRGIAHDGKYLWALDHKGKRICIIEKTESGKEITKAMAAKRKTGK
jgi:hypothetical protein